MPSTSCAEPMASALAPSCSAEVPPSVRALLNTARAVLGMELTFLAALEDGRQTFTAVDAVTDSAVVPIPEGTVVPVSDGYCDLMLTGQIPTSVPDVAAHPLLAAMPVTAAHQVAAYCGVPVRLPDGTLHGTLCGLDGEAGRAPTVGQLEALRTIAGLVGVRIAEERAAAVERSRRAQALLSTVDGRGLSTVLQPIVGLRSGTVVGFEALSRFGARPPAEVFAEARTLDVGVPLELAAARAALDLLPRLPVGTYLAVNLSPQAAVDPSVLALITTVVDAGAGPRLVLELTEHEQVADYDVLIAALADARAGGVRLAVDDTGSGFASLQHVTRLRPDILKLDMAFVRGVHRDPARRAVARDLLAVARDLGAVLVAEGVEEAAELGEQLRLGALVGQGFHLGRPGPPDQVLARLVADPDGAERFVLT